MPLVARVLIDSPLPQLDRLFDYAIPPALRADAVPGVRVKVPLRTAGRVVEGYLVEVVERPEPSVAGKPLSELDAVVSPVAVLTPELYALARRVADRAAGSASDILRLVIPKRMVRAEKAWLAARVAAVADASDAVVSGGGDSGATGADAAVSDAGAAKAADADADAAADADAGVVDAGASDAEASAAGASDTAASDVESTEPAAAGVAWARGILSDFPDLPAALADHARIALDAPPRPAAAGPYGAWAELVSAIALDTLARGQSTLIVVPDQRDEDQVLAVLAAHAPEGVVVQGDARRSGPERYASYLRLLGGETAIVVGNRSTVYAPAADVGTVIIWDDGDPLLSEQLSPGVHARDAALVRQELEGSALVLAGHTRTTDVERLVQLGWVREVTTRRRESPTVVLSATRDGEARGQRVPSAAFAAAREALTHGPVLVQVARPGYAPVLVCADCRTPARCPHCTGPLRSRRPGAAPECTWCGRTIGSWACGNCQSTRLRMASSGSERTADELGRAFPNTRVIVADGEHPVTRVDARPALVVATRGAEPHADGGYRAVILLDGDRMLLAEQLRIGESCLRWWSNAAALAAPSAPVHLVGVTGPVARALATWTQPAYARAELADRAPLHMPPTVRVAAVEGTATSVETALGALREAVPTLDAGAVLGPVPRDGSGAGGTATSGSSGRPAGTGAGTGAGVRALVRFDYALGRPVAEALRAAVVADALHGRSRDRRAGADRFAPRTTLKVRLDVPELDL